MKLTPLADRVVLKPMEAEETTKGGIILTSAAKEKPSVAEVVSVGRANDAAGRRKDAPQGEQLAQTEQADHQEGDPPAQEEGVLLCGASFRRPAASLARSCSSSAASRRTRPPTRSSPAVYNFCAEEDTAGPRPPPLPPTL